MTTVAERVTLAASYADAAVNLLVHARQRGAEDSEVRALEERAAAWAAVAAAQATVAHVQMLMPRSSAPTLDEGDVDDPGR